MSYDFSTHVDRRGTSSHKWQAMFEANPEVEEGILPISVADMELKSPPEIYEGLSDYLKEEPIIGYTGAPDSYLEAVVNWQEKHHDWAIDKEWIITTPGVVAAIHTAIKSFSKEGDGVIIFKPVYNPFSQTIEGNKRTIVNVPLLENDGYYTIDYDQFEKAAAKSENKILLFCSPHNPVGRVWTKDELERLADIAVKHDLIVIADEIWNDIVQEKFPHTTLAKVNKELKDHLITMTSVSKTFNLAGISTSNIIIPNEKLRETFAAELFEAHLSFINIFGYEATRIAYTTGETWLKELNVFIHENQQLVHDFFKEYYPKIKAPISEGTYVQWVDFSSLDMTPEERTAFLEEAQVFTNSGSMFGKEGAGYERFNVASPTDALRKILNRLLKALNERDKK